MKENNLNNKSGRVFHHIFGAAGVILFAIIVMLVLLSGKEMVPMVMNGEYQFDGKDAFSYEAVLAGEWLRYPDVLLYSDPPEQVPEPQKVQIPDLWIGTGADTHIPETANATYCIIIKDFYELFGHSNVILSLQGLVQNYRVFLNGRQLNVRIPSPTGYPLYAIDGEGDLELAIELIDSSTGFTLAPEISAIGVHIGNIDTNRNVLFISFTLFLILFLMFLVFSCTSSSKGLRPLVVLGFLLTALFLFNTLWATGYLDAVNTVFSNKAIFIATQFLRVMIAEYLLFYIRKTYPEIFSGKASILCGCLLAAGFVIYLVFAEIMNVPIFWYFVYALFAAGGLLWFLYIFFGKHGEWKDSFDKLILNLLVFSCLMILPVYDWFPNHYALLYCLPATIICVIADCFLSYYRFQQSALRRMEELLEIERYASRTQTALLSSQIQPHFLYNTLLTIQELCRFDPPEASRVIVRFSNYLRHNIDFMNYAELIPFESEETHIDNYIYIQQARFQDKLSYSADIRTRDFKIPPLTLQPIIENAIKYGVRGRLEGGFVHVTVYEDSVGVHLIVRNSGSGFDENKVSSTHSLGNIRTRLKTLLNASLTISSQEGKEGTTVEILIPAKEVQRNETGDRG